MPDDSSQPVTQKQLREALETTTATITALIKETYAEQRAAIQAAAAEQRAAIQAAAAEQHAAIQAAEERAQEFARGIETNLLTAFHGHAKGQTARLHTAELTTHDMGIRIAALEERVLNLETRQRPPQ